MPSVVPREVQGIAVAVAMLENEPVEEHKDKLLFPSLGDEALIFPQRKEGATAKPNVGRLFETLQTILAGWKLIARLQTGDEGDCAHVDFHERVRAFVFLSC